MRGPETQRWLTLVERAYDYAYTRRLNELNGSRVKEWRGDGLHQWSWLWGQIDAAETDEARDVAKEHNVSPMELRRLAETAALDEFVRRAAAGDTTTRA